MRILFIVLSILLISCQTTNKPKEDSTKKPENKVILNESSEVKLNITLPVSVEFSDTIKSDTFALTIGNENLVIVRNGKVLKSGSTYFDIKPLDEIKMLYILPKDGDFIVFYVSSDGDSGASFAKRISPSQNKILWESPLAAFNLATPAIVGDYAYLSTLGFIGKLDLNKGEFIWKFQDMNMKFSKLFPPKFLKDSLVLFSIWPSSADYILIDDAQGKIVKIYN